MTDARLYAPAAARNRDPILDVLREVLPAQGRVLEIASGSGEHVVHFAKHLPALTFQPTDPDAQAVRSIDAWANEAKLRNIDPALQFNVTQPNWPAKPFVAVICINMIHIAPWAATLALFRGAASALTSGAPLYLYGPYRRRDVPTATSNKAFDTSLRLRNAAWGLRDLEDVEAVAAEFGFSPPAIVEMPANNLSVTFRLR